MAGPVSVLKLGSKTKRDSASAPDGTRSEAPPEARLRPPDEAAKHIEQNLLVLQRRDLAVQGRHRLGQRLVPSAAAEQQAERQARYRRPGRDPYRKPPIEPRCSCAHIAFVRHRRQAR